MQLWWTHDLGAQPLYNLALTYTSGSGREGGSPSDGSRAGAAPAAEAASVEGGSSPGSSSSSSSSSRLTRRIGLRRVELVTQPLPGGGPGETFFFRLNGQPLYARGEAAPLKPPGRLLLLQRLSWGR